MIDSGLLTFVEIQGDEFYSKLFINVGHAIEYIKLQTKISLYIISKINIGASVN